MKQQTTDTAVEDVGEIKERQSDTAIFNAWRRRKNIRETARETGLTIAEVKRRLKRILKEKLKQEVKNHEQENNS